MDDAMNHTYQALRAAAIAEMARIEAMSRDELDRYQLALLNAQLAYAAARAPLYRERFAPLPPPVDGLDALGRLPFTTKEDLRAAYPFGLLAAPRRSLIRYGESTGTTGRPTSSFITYADWIAGNVWVEAALRAHFGEDDLAFIAIPYELTFASYDLDRALEQIGCAVVAVGTLNQICPFPRLVEMMRDVRPTCLVCTPSRALRLYDMLRERGDDPLRVGLRALLYVGETCAPAKLDKLAALWQARLVSAYGSTETNSLALPCARGASHLSEGRYLFEVIDPVHGVPLALGESGELVLTSLRAEAMPLIRYRTGDLVALSPEPCPCGSPRRVLQHRGRVCEAIAIDGRSLYKIDVEEEVLATPGTGLYYAAGERGGALHVAVEVAAGEDPRAVCDDVAARLRRRFRVEPAVRRLDRGLAARAMDRMLKPGSLTLSDIDAAGAA